VYVYGLNEISVTFMKITHPLDGEEITSVTREKEESPHALQKLERAPISRGPPAQN